MRRHSFIATLGLTAFASGCATDITLIPGTSPQRITVVSKTSDATLFWEDVPGASGYRVYSGRKIDGNDPPVGPGDYEERGGDMAETSIAKIENMQYPDEGDPRLAISFTVVALRGNGVSEPSDEVLGWRQDPYYGRFPVWTAQTSGVSFGVSMSGIGDVDDDGFEDVAIGAAGVDSGAGAVFFYRGSPTGLVEAGRFDGESAGDRVGAALASSGSWLDGQGTLLVGAPGVDRVYVFGPGLASPSPTPILALEIGVPGSGFGSTVADAGNLDGDLVPFRSEIAIGAPLFGGGGAVFVYTGLEEFAGDSAPPSPVVVVCLDALLAPIQVPFAGAAACAGDDEELGFSLAAAGNLTNDPWDDLIIGVPGFGADDRGAVVLYEGSTTLASDGRVTLAEGAVGLAGDGSRFGEAVASVGDADGDSLDEVVVGSGEYDLDIVNHDVGRIVIFPGVPVNAPYPTATPTFETHEGQRTNSRFGGSLLFVRNLADAAYGLLVGSTSEDLEGEAVAVRRVHGYIATPFGGSTSTWALGQELTPPFVAPGIAGTESDEEPHPVGLGSADVDGDGVSDILLSDSASGVVQLFVSTPGVGPEVYAGPLYETGTGAFRLSLASFVDPQPSVARCHVEWDLQPDSPLPGDGEPCTPESLRTDFSHTYAESREHVVRITVTSADGRRGQAITRVLVR